MSIKPIAVPRRLLLARVWGFTLAVTACTQSAITSATPPPIAPGAARIWVYRDFLPSESLNATDVMINGSQAGQAPASGGAFYRDVPPGHYLVAARSWGTDVNQTANFNLTAGEEAYVKIESLRAWSSFGDKTAIERDTFYARRVPPQLARAELAHMPINPGS
ncbi:MAG: hypothetical protein J2P48_18830 [Alphaproteobacteria bacterium]|nr:hypothetical protein [Alphaproteobacteria bacterium]